MHVPFIFIYNFLKARKWFALAAFITIFLLSLFFASKIRILSNVEDFFPENKDIAAFKNSLQLLKNKDQLIVHFTTDSNNNTDILIQAAKDFSTSLSSSKNKKLIKEIVFETNTQLFNEMYDSALKYAPLLLTDADYDSLYARLQPETLKQRLDANYAMASAPISTGPGDYAFDDPLGIGMLVINKLSKLNAEEKLDLSSGYFLSKDNQHLLILITPTFSGSDTKNSELLLNDIETTLNSISKKHPVQFSYFGAHAVALGNNKQVTSDSIKTGVIALIGIILLLLSVFKNLRAAILLIIPAALSIVTALAIIYFLKGSIISIALGAATVIAGIGINYSIHLLNHYKHCNQPQQLIKELSQPLLIGNFTTVGAFIGLQFAQSPALRDFGLLAALSLVLAAIYTLIFLPLFLTKPTLNSHQNLFEKTLNKIAEYPFEKKKWWILGVVVLCLSGWYFSSRVEFDGDMMHLNYMSDDLKKAENDLNKISSLAQSAVYIVSSASSEIELAYNLKDINRISRTIPPLDLLYIYPDKAQASLRNWELFSKTISLQETKNLFLKHAQTLDLDADIYNSFFQLIESKIALPNQAFRWLPEDLYKPFIFEENGNWISNVAVKIPSSEREKLRNEISPLNKVAAIDRQKFATDIVNSIQTDFTKILLISSLIVFVSLFIAFGRIETTAFAFLPLVISWVVILGIMGLFKIPFNVISIIISTFIFGLCDDYSIFIAESLKEDYKSGTKTLSAHKNAILLSVLVTIIGIGVLIFAKHPALKSISIITIIGMLTVVLVSFTIQPFLFRFFITGRTEKGLAPMTIYSLLATLYTYGQFLIGCIVISLYCIVFIFPPWKNQTLRKRILHWVVMFSTKGTVASWFWVKQEKRNFSKQLFDKPSVIVCNHQSHIDLLQVQSWTPNMIIMVNDWVYNSPFFGWIVKMNDYQFAGNGIDLIYQELQKKFNEGYSILIFPEGTRSIDGTIGRFHKGAFYLAEKLNADILPIVIHGNCDVFQKGELNVKGGQITLKALDRIKPDDLRYGANYSERTKAINKLFRDEYSLLQQEIERGWYNFNKVMRAYRFKGPIAEWYTRIKGITEKYYHVLNEVIPRKAIITDIGCGNGMMSHSLWMYSKQRNICGIDYDEEKIQLANSAYYKPKTVQFYTADARNFEYKNSDVFILSDVLHYLREEEQIQLLNIIYTKLNEGGKIIVRDGIKEVGKKHEGTVLTEVFSTQIFKYNKTSNELSFLSIKTLEEFAASHQLKMKQLNETQITSNLIFVFEKG